MRAGLDGALAVILDPAAPENGLAFFVRGLQFQPNVEGIDSTAGEKVADLARSNDHVHANIIAATHRSVGPINGRRDRAKLKLMIDFAYARNCRQQTILRYFGEADPARCGNCDICLETAGPSRAPDEDEALIVRKALSGVARMSWRGGQGCEPRFGRLNETAARKARNTRKHEKDHSVSCFRVFRGYRKNVTLSCQDPRTSLYAAS